MGTLQPPKLWGSGFDRPVAIMAGLTACAVLVRLPFLFNTGVDEAFYLVVGRQWLEGMPPYAHSFDVKPPLLFALMAAAEAAFGPSLLAAKALAMASVSATAYALFLFGGRFLSERAGVTAALLYIRTRGRDRRAFVHPIQLVSWRRFLSCRTHLGAVCGLWNAARLLCCAWPKTAIYMAFARGRFLPWRCGLREANSHFRGGAAGGLPVRGASAVR